MSKRDPNAESTDTVAVFAALGDDTRAILVKRLSDGDPKSISQLVVLQQSGLVASRRIGRETQFVFVPSSLRVVQDYLKEVSAKWDDALSRLKSFVEDPRH